jgi:hypothetical protein
MVIQDDGEEKKKEAKLAMICPLELRSEGA